jgi:hypothetical protein
MRRLFVLWLLTFVTATASAVASDASEQKRREAKQCGDFLAELGRSHSLLKFTKCEPATYLQLKVLRATYRVTGANASHVEKYLVNSARMAKLRFLCCGWEVAPTKELNAPKYGQYLKGLDRFEVSMMSDETVVNKRSRWKEIPFFVVEVTYFIDTP